MAAWIICREGPRCGALNLFSNPKREGTELYECDSVHPAVARGGPGAEGEGKTPMSKVFVPDDSRQYGGSITLLIE